MKRERAIEVMDRLVEAGYTTRITAVNLHDHVVREDDKMVSITYRVDIAEMSLDSIDLKHLTMLADELDLDCGFSPMSGGQFSFSERDKTPEVIRNRRRHPK
jgi:hypothetical protein